MSFLAVICELPGPIITFFRRRLRINRISYLQLFVLAVICIVIIWKSSSSNNLYNLTMGFEGPAFKNIIDKVTWSMGDNGIFEIRNQHRVVLTTHMNSASQNQPVKPCSKEDDPYLCIQIGSDSKTVVSPIHDDPAQCFKVRTTSMKNGHHPSNCFELRNMDVSDGALQTHWYGGAATYSDRWPAKWNIPERAHVSDHGSYGSVHERYWFSNQGVGVYVENDVPLFVKADDSSFCLIGKYDGNIYTNKANEMSYLKYTICVTGNVLDIHKYMSKTYMKKPQGIPDEKMIKYPVWSTWAKYKSGITQELTIQFTNEIVEHGLPACQIEVDDRYTVNYGDYIFDPVKFPTPKEMIDYIHSKEFRVTVWTHPFSNYESAAYDEGKNLDFWVKDASGSKPGEATWWRGRGGALDVTNPDAVTWFHKRLNVVRDLGVDGHKFDAGEIGFLPRSFTTKKTLANPCEYSSIYAEAMYNITNNFMQMRVGYRSQHLPIFISMMDRSSSWDSDMGIQSLITTSLVFGSLGYFFIMPDMIGGNAYCSGNMDCTNVKPDRELYIRWIELTAFLPMMQFSIPPWQYDKEVVRIAKKYTTLHADYVAPLIIALAKESMLTGNPIIRPMWWVAPDDPASHTIANQFMIGNDVIVAPILEPTVMGRRIYLPRGIWRDMLHAREYPVEEDNYYFTYYDVAIDEIPYFERVLIP